MIFLILGPAGSGKTTLCTQLEQFFEGIKIFTTRKPRIDDKDNYSFVTNQEFLDLYEKKKWC